MPRPKQLVPTPPHVTSEAMAKRAAKSPSRKPKLRVVAGTAAARALGIK